MSFDGGPTAESFPDSYTKDLGYGPEEDVEGLSFNDTKPKLLLMGLRRSGKSSIQRVVFHKMSPAETLFLESTNKIVKDVVPHTSFIQFHVWDFPGQVDFLSSTFDTETIFTGCGAILYVIDSQDNYGESLNRLRQTVVHAYKVNPQINFEVLIHKVDGLSDEQRIETQRHVHQRAREDLLDAGLDSVQLSMYLTSIYDHSILEAISKIVQKLIPELPVLENLLNIFIANSGVEKAFLFDVASKIYIATDSSQVDMQSLELACDMIDVVIDVSCIYGLKGECDNGFDGESTSQIRLDNSTLLYLRQVNQFLALVCIIREDNFRKQGLIDYNFSCFRRRIQEMFDCRASRESTLECVETNGEVSPDNTPPCSVSVDA